MNGHAAAALLGVALALGTRSAAAQPDDAADELTAAEEAASALFERGLRLSEEEDWAGAREAFEGAYSIAPHHTIQYNIGVCRQALGDHPGAVEAFTAYLDQGGEGIPAERREDVEAMLAGLQQSVALLVVEVDRADAVVEVDGVVRGTSPLSGPLVVGAGDHAVAARLGDGTTAGTHVTVAGGDSSTVRLAFGDAGGGGTVHPVWFWVSAGAAAALGAAGAATGALTLAAADDFDAAVSLCRDGSPGACSDGQGIADRHDAYRLATNVLLPAAGAFAAGALVLFFFTEFGDGEAPPVAIGLEPDGTSLGVSARFAF